MIFVLFSIITCVLGLILFLIKNEEKLPDNMPPGISRKLPKLKNIFKYSSGGDKSKKKLNVLEQFHAFNQTYGPIAFKQIGSVPSNMALCDEDLNSRFLFDLNDLVIMEDYDLVKEVLYSDVWMDRQSKGNDMLLHRSCGKELGLIFNNSNRNWREMRKFSLKTLREFGFGKQKTMEGSIEEELNYFTQSLRERLQKEGPVLSMRRFFNVSVLNVIWTMFAGCRFCYDDKKLLYLTELVNTWAQGNGIGDPTGLMSLFTFFPLLGKILPKFYTFESYKINTKLQKFFRTILEERRAEGYYKTDQRDFIDVFLKEIDNHKNDPPETNVFTDDQFIIVAIDFFMAGSDTTSFTLEFAFLYMLKNPEIQKKIQEEIDRVVGRDRPPSVLDRANMPYTEAAVNEVQRLANIVPLIARVTVKEIEFHGYTIPKGAVGVLNMNTIHMNEKTWKNPGEFRPERFLDENNHVINTEKILPFGAGRRMCIGETMSKASLFTYFTTLLQQFEFCESPEHGLPSIEPKLGFTLNPQHYYALIKERHT